MKVASWARHQAGFTLLEVLLVAMLMGLVATAVTLSMGAPGDRELDKQARRFMATLQQARSIRSWMAGCWGCGSRRTAGSLCPGAWDRSGAHSDRVTSCWGR